MSSLHGVMPGAPYALQVIHPGSPTLRIRYRHGILVNPYGFPDWLLYARALVRVGSPRADRPAQRVLDVLAANEAMARAGDPLWRRESYVAGTPEGWVWADLGGYAPQDRRLALVPADLHGSYRHAGGARTLPAGPAGPVTDAGSRPVRWRPTQLVPEEALLDAEAHLGHRLPPRYRQFLARTNGGGPDQAAVIPAGGFVVDQPWFGVSRADLQQDLRYANPWLRDRFSPRYLAIGHVQGGILVIDITDDSVWFWDDDDPRSRQEDRPTEIGRHLVRCADHVEALVAALATPGEGLLRTVDALVDAGEIRPLREELAGACLPPRQRPPGQSGRDKAAASDPLAKLLDNPPPAPAGAVARAPDRTASAPATPAASLVETAIESHPWHPANELEAALVEAVRAGDHGRYVELLTSAVLYLPGYGGAPGPDSQRFATWRVGDRAHLLVFTSTVALREFLVTAGPDAGGGAGTVDSYLTTSLAELTAKWPDPSWRLAVNPHLQIGAALDVTALALIRSGQAQATTLGEILAEGAGLAEFEPANPAEAALHRALDGESAELLLAALRGAQAYLLTADEGDPFGEQQPDGSVTLVAFTSPELCQAWRPAELDELTIAQTPLADLAREWPGPQFRLCLNPGSPVTVTLEAAELARIAEQPGPGWGRPT